MTVASNTLSYLCWHFYVYVVTPFINFLIIIRMIVSTEILPPSSLTLSVWQV
jgi:hypothetical protein